MIRVWARSITRSLFSFLALTAIVQGQGTYSFTPLDPIVVEITDGAIGAPAYRTNHSSKPGELTFDISSISDGMKGNGTLTVVPPPAVTGEIVNNVFRFAAPAVFTINTSVSVFRRVNLIAFTTDGLLSADGASLPVTIGSIAYDPSAGMAVLNVRVGVRLPITPTSEFNGSEIRLLVSFRWSLTLPGDLDQAQPTGSFPPPEASDTTFLNSKFIPAIDRFAGKCIFRDDGPIDFDIPIGRWVGDFPEVLNPDQTLKVSQKLIDNGVIGKTAKLRIAVWDVDSAPRTGAVLEERNVVTLNGRDIGDLAAASQDAGKGKQAILKGVDKQWTVNEFEVPIELLRFALRGTDGSPTPGLNKLSIGLDTLATVKPTWCTTVAWASLSFDAMAPWMLVHGTNAQHGSWEEPIQGVAFVGRLKELGVPFEHLIDLEPNAPAERNAELLQKKLLAITIGMGVETVHLIGHSKGGTDSRAFLASPLYQPSPTDGTHKLTVKSLFALGTPSQGTVLSDLTVAANQAGIMKDVTYEAKDGSQAPLPFVKAPDMTAVNAPGGPLLMYDGLLSVFAVDLANRSWNGRFVGEYIFAEPPDSVQGIAPAGSALRQQTIAGMRVFNSRVKKAPGVCYYSIAGDADTDGDGEVSAAEAEGMLPADKLWNDYAKGKLVTSTMYQILGRVQSAEVVENKNPNGRKYYVAGKIRPFTELFPHGKNQVLTPYAANDLVGPVSSVHCESCGFIPLATTENNHSSLKRTETVDFILKKISSNFPLGKPALPCSK